MNAAAGSAHGNGEARSGRRAARIGNRRGTSRGFGQAPAVCRSACQNARIARILRSNKTRQGYARERILKPAGYFFVRLELARLDRWGHSR